MELAKIQETKSFWKRPEGVSGTIFLLGLVAGGVFLFNKILPWLINFLQSALHLMILCGVLGSLVYILLDPNFRKGVWYLYKMAMRKFTGFIVTIDPIEIIKIHIEKLRERRGEMNDKMVLVKGQQVKLDRTIQKNVEDYNSAMSIAEQANKAGDRGEVAVKAREAGRLQKSNERLVPLRKKLIELYEFLSKLYKNSDYLIRDMESEVKVTEIEYTAIKEGASAIKSAKSIFLGGDDDMYKQAVDFLEQDMSNKIGYIDQFMRDTESIIKSLEYEDGAFESEGMKKLEAFKESDFTFLLTGDLKDNQNGIKQINQFQKIGRVERPQSNSSSILGLLD